MTVETRLENGVFELLDKTGNFIAEHSLVFLLGLILLILLGGVWLLVVLRKSRAHVSEPSRTGFGFGILIGTRPPPSQEPPPPFTTGRPHSWDDQRD